MGEKILEGSASVRRAGARGRSLMTPPPAAVSLASSPGYGPGHSPSPARARARARARGPALFFDVANLFSAMQTKLDLTDEGEVDWSTALSGSSLRTASSLLRLRCILRLRGLRIPLRRMATEARSILFTIWRTSVLATTVGAVPRNPVRAQQRRMPRRHLALLKSLI